MTLIRAALDLAHHGFEIFPVNEHTKAPYTTNGMKDASSDQQLVEQWWHQHPNALIGNRIPEHHVVLDIDPRHHGDKVWDALELTYSPIIPTRRHHSGRGDGGHHDWFQHPGGKLSTRRLTDWARANGVGAAAGKRSWTAGIDILHHGHRYTILPPSPHPETGLPYEWDQFGEPGPMPVFLAELLRPAPVAPTPPRESQIDGDSIADWFTDSHSWHDILPPAGWVPIDGDGDSDGSTWRHPNASAATSASVRHGCLFVYSDNTDFEVTADGDPRGITKFRAWATLEHGSDLVVAARAARYARHGPPFAWPNVTTITDSNGEWKPPTPLVDWIDAYGNGEDPQHWLAKPLLPTGGAIAIFAKGGTGKSLLALWLAANLATAPEPIEVLYLDYEMTLNTVVERLEDMGYDDPTQLSHLHYASLPSLPPLDTAEGGRAVLDMATHLNIDLVVIDTFGRAVEGEENQADTVRAWYRWTGQLLKQAGIAFLRIDHAGKDMKKGQRGTSAKNDDVDIVWEMTDRKHGEFLLRATKRRVSWVDEQVVVRQTKINGVLGYQWDDSTGVAYYAGYKEVATQLDQLGAPVDISRRAASLLLRTEGQGRDNNVVLSAIQYRRSQDHSKTTHQQTPKTTTETKHKTPEQTTCRPLQTTSEPDGLGVSVYEVDTPRPGPLLFDDD